MLAAYPQAALWQDSEGVCIARAWARRTGQREGFLGRPGAALARLASPERIPGRAGGAAVEATGPFRGGWFVYLGYELAAEIEPKLALPAALAGAERTAGVCAARARGADLRSRPPGGPGAGRGRAVEALQHRLVERTRRPPGSIPDAGRPEVADPGRARARGGGSATIRLARRPALEHIRAGDIYQANLSRGWRARLRCAPARREAMKPRQCALYERLRTQNPAPFAALAQFQDWRGMSSSPERLVRVRGGQWRHGR